MSSKVLILKGVPTLLADKKHLLKPVSIFYFLKAEFKSSSILDFPKRMVLLSKICSCGERTLYSRFKQLDELGLIKMQFGRIDFVSYAKMHGLIKTKEDKGKYHYLKGGIKPEYLIRTLAIQENVDR